MVVALLGWSGEELRGSQTSQQPVFKSSVDLVSLTVVVQRNGRNVTGLTANDFELLDSGQRQPIVSFQADSSPVSIGLLFDGSGSMDVSAKVKAGRAAAHHLLSWLEPGKDRIGVFTFDTDVQEQQAFTTVGPESLNLLEKVKPWGSTSIYDAIAKAGRQVAELGGSRRALLVVTDGADNRSHMRPTQVAAVASGLDVPVYVLVMSTPLDHPGTETSVDREGAPTRTGALEDLARATGGSLHTLSAPAHASIAVRQIVEELRHQYLIAFAPTTRAGWHPLTIRTRDPHLVVRARHGYVAGPLFSHTQ
jgi:Ca-activated chloride channel family protein